MFKHKAKKTRWNVKGLIYAASLSNNLMINQMARRLQTLTLTCINMFENIAEIVFYFFFYQAFLSRTKPIHKTVGEELYGGDHFYSFLLQHYFIAVVFGFKKQVVWVVTESYKVITLSMYCFS